MLILCVSNLKAPNRFSLKNLNLELITYLLKTYIKMSKRNYEKRMREEEEAAAHVFQDFLTSFQDVSTTPAKVFIKSGIINSDQSMNTTDLSKNQIYMPKPVIASKNFSLKTALECAKILKETEVSKNRHKEKPRSNLETLKEEIKQRQLQKEESNSSNHQSDTNDPCSTNLFIANLNPKISEEQLMILFGKYGALASVKIMWPRGEEKFRNFTNTNCGFVAFMSRKDAERALIGLGYRDDMRLSWGKSVEIPPHPIYIPPRLTKLFLPPPCSGLPFNAQPTDLLGQPKNQEELERLLSTSMVKVTIPLDKKVLCTIHRMIEFVVREGSLFEALIMMTEVNNSDFAFLFDYRSPLHVYYRWKLFSILNGDGQRAWSLKPFRMVKGGPVWIPPKPIDYTSGMPDDLIADEDGKVNNELLSEAQCARLRDLIKNLNLSRSKIQSAMSFCISHVGAIGDSLNIVFDSLKHASTNPTKKIARLYLLSDIFCNCRRIRGVKLSKYEFGTDLDEIFRGFHSACVPLGKIDKENFKIRVLAVLRSWHNHLIFSSIFVEKLEGLFLELIDDEDSIIDEPLDGASLLKRKSVTNLEVKIVQQNTEKNHFISSSWNRVDPKDLESQAMSTQKLYELEMSRIDVEEDKGKKKYKKRKKEDYTVTVSSKWDSDDDLN